MKEFDRKRAIKMMGNNQTFKVFVEAIYGTMLRGTLSFDDMRLAIDMAEYMDERHKEKFPRMDISHLLKSKDEPDAV